MNEWSIICFYIGAYYQRLSFGCGKTIKLTIYPFQYVENFEEYLELPSSFDINEYEFMRDFCFLVEEEPAKNDLLSAIQGRGAFRRFKDRVACLGMLDEWYQYRNGRHRTIAVEWCEENGVEYREGRVVQGD